jgi:hypothetical protein
LYALRDRGTLSEELASAVAETMSNGLGDPIGNLPNAYSHQPAELADELRAAGLRDIEVLGIEGPGWHRFTPDIDERRVELVLEAALRTARLCDAQPEIVASSAHLLACARRP